MGWESKALAIFVFLLVVVLLVASCGKESPGGWRLVDSETWQGKAKMSMWVQNDVLKPDQSLYVRVQVENLSDETLQYTMWNIGDPPIYTRLQQPYGNAIPLRASGDPVIVQPAVNFGTLEPKKVIEREVRWDVTIPVGSTSIKAPNGDYTVEAVFYRGRQADKPSPEPIILSHKIQVTGSTSLILPEDARKKALAQPSVQRWLEAHTGAAVAREQKGKYFINLGGNWQSASREAYGQALNAAQSPSVTFEAGQWRVLFASKFGFPPSEIVVKINAETTEVSSIIPDLQAELKGGVVATFQVQSSKFRIFVTNPDTITELFRLQRGESSAHIPNGRILPGPGAGLHNAPWSWHLDPKETQMAEFTIELCDGTLEMVEDELDYWLNQVMRFCPWSAKLVDIKDYR